MAQYINKQGEEVDIKKPARVNTFNRDGHGQTGRMYSAAPEDYSASVSGDNWRKRFNESQCK